MEPCNIERYTTRHSSAHPLQVHIYHHHESHIQFAFSKQASNVAFHLLDVWCLGWAVRAGGQEGDGDAVLQLV